MDLDPTEHVQEHLQHTVAHGEHADHGEHAAHGDHHGHVTWWITAAALTAAFLAAFAAVAGFLATSHLTQSTLIRIKANDDWNYYQAKSIKSSVIDLKIYSATLAHTTPRQTDFDTIKKYATQMPEIQTTAKGLEKLSDRHLNSHETYESAGTMFHIAIAIVAIAVVAKRKEFWYVSMVAGAVGVVLFTVAYAKSPPSMTEEEEPPAATAPEHPGEHAAKSHPATSHPAASHMKPATEP